MSLRKKIEGFERPLSINDLCEILGLSRRSVEKLGRLQLRKARLNLGSKQVLFDPQAVATLLFSPDAETEAVPRASSTKENKTWLD